jgi:hypothetical protein
MSKKLAILIIPIIAAFFIVGCTFTITIPDIYDVRIVNKTGETIKIKIDDDSYRYVENECVIVISAIDAGYHELAWIWNSSSRRSSDNTFKIEVDADLEITINDDPDETVIRWD